MTEKQLRDDLNQLWMCGLPGYGPGDLIDFEFSGDTIEVTFSAGIDHPLRLTSPEATGVLVALRALVDVPGMVDPEAARSAIAKIESAAGTVDHGPRPPSTNPRRWRARRRPRSARRCAATGRCPSSTTRPPTTCCPAGSSTRSGWCWSPTTATWRRGAGRPRVCGCSGSTASSTHRCSTNRRRRPEPAVQAAAGHLAVRRGPVAAVGDAAHRPVGVVDVRLLPAAGDPGTARRACEAAMTYASDEWMARFVLGLRLGRAGTGTRIAGRSGSGESAAAALACVWRRCRDRAGRLAPDVWR